MRTSIWAPALALGAVVLAACGGGGDSGNSGSAPAIAVSCPTAGDIGSYRYTMSLRLQSPAFEEPLQPTPEHPLSVYRETLNRLFSDYRLEGAFEAPDRYQAVVRFQEDELELRAIADKSWLRVGTTWLEDEAPPEEGSLLTLESVCEEIATQLALSLGSAESQEDTVSGVEADRYHLDGAELAKLPELLGTGPEVQLPQRFVVDLWLAREERWPLRWLITASDTDEQGRAIGLQWSLEFHNINDPNIEIEPPLLSPVET